MQFRPIGTQILIELEENKPVGDILLPDATETFDFSMFVVRAVGQGHLTIAGNYAPLPVKEGDRVKLKGSAKGNMVALEPWLVSDRKLCTVDIAHVAGAWEGDMPSPATVRRLVRATPAAINELRKPVLTQ